MKRSFALSVAVLLLAGRLFAADDLASGPKVGEAAKGFEVQVATGDKAGKKLDLLAEWKKDKKPVLVIFYGEMTRPGFGLLKILDKYGQVRQPDGLEVFIVRTTDDAEAAIKYAKILEEKYEIKGTAAVASDGKAGPKEYGIHEDAQMTVLLLDKEHKVALNVARRNPERQDFDGIRKGIDKLLGPSPVPFP